ERIQGQYAEQRAVTRLSAALLHADLRPPEGPSIQTIYGFWARKFRWTVEEAAALVMGMDPKLLEMYEIVVPSQGKGMFQILLDYFRRRFTDEVFPGDLRHYAPTIGIENECLWSAIDYFHTKKQKLPRQSDEKKKQNTRDQIVFALALNHGFRSGKPNQATGIIKRLLDKV